MKYNEAIDMILDGGRARIDDWAPEDFWIELSDDGLIDCKRGEPYLVEKYEYTVDNWIVEKDGVVYEECPAKTLYDTCKKVPWPDEPKSIAIDEDWLEKKMLCFVRRYKISGNPGVPGDKYVHQKDFSKCYNAECPFCFPEDKRILYTRACNHIEGIGNIDNCPFCFPEDKNKRQYPDFIDCERCGMSMYKTNEMLLSLPPQPVYRCPNCDDKEDIVEEDRPEKVTFYEMSCLITSFAEDYHLSKAMGDHGSVKQYILGNSKIEKLLREKLEYLVSLQDK